MKIIFIRHGKTAGNLEKRYIGKTDEPLCNEGISELCGKKYPDCELVIASPKKRCLETAKIIYPDLKPVALRGLEECDFGDFEGKNFAELEGDSYYQKWLRSGGKLNFPGGEAVGDFKERCTAAFEEAVEKYRECGAISFVVHGGTIMSVLEKYAVPKKDYYDFQVKNACGYVTFFDGEKIIVSEQI